MGSPKSTTVYPQLVQSVQPKESYEMTGDYLGRLQKQTNTAQQQLYTQSGTPGEVGVRQAATRQQAAGTYLASLPSGDKYTRANSGVTDQYAPAREAGQTAFSQAQKDYADALAKSTQAPPPAYDEEQMKTPSWAKSTIAAGMPGYNTSSSSSNA